MTDRRDPNNTQAWLIGSGIESLAAAIHLIYDAHVPGPNIHILDLHEGCGGRLKTSGDVTDGYFLPVECHPYFHGPCTERLLSLVPSDDPEYGTLMDAVNAYSGQRPPQEAVTRAVKHDESGLEVAHMRGFQLGLKHRASLIWFLVESEHTLGAKSIDQVLDAGFFETEFWTLWSTTFGLQPWHSAVEFHRHLRKYLDDIRSLHTVKTFHRTRYNLYDSLVRPLTAHMQSRGVDFRFNVEVTSLDTYPSSDPTTVSEIHYRNANGPDSDEYLVTLDPQDICIVTLGSTTTNAAMGTNTTRPPYLSRQWEDHLISEWGLWQGLAHQSPKFGNPTNFLTRGVQAPIETFTTTLWGPQFPRLMQELLAAADQHPDDDADAATLSLPESNWSLTLTLPRQPVFPSQPANVTVILGSALQPARTGNFVPKHMYECTGREVFEEVLRHLDFPVESILEASTTVPCGLPLGTAPFLARDAVDRPAVIPENTTNIACVGQFVEVPDDTALSVEYGVRGAQVAVSGLMGTDLPMGSRKNILWEVFDLMR